MVLLEINAILKTNVHPIMNVDGLKVVTSVSQGLLELVVKIKDRSLIGTTVYRIGIVTLFYVNIVVLFAIVIVIGEVLGLLLGLLGLPE
jgi:hypothetical protein